MGRRLNVGECIVELIDADGWVFVVCVGPSGEGESVSEHRERAKRFSEQDAVRAARWFGQPGKSYRTENTTCAPVTAQVVKRIG